MKRTILFMALVFFALFAWEAFSQAATGATQSYDELLGMANDRLERGNPAQAAEIIEGMRQRWPDDVALVEYLGIIYVNMPSDRPDFRKAREYLELAEREYSENRDVYYNLACVYSALGKADDAANTLRRAIVFGYTDLAWALQDPDMENLRETPWWKGIAAHVGEIQALLESVPVIQDSGALDSPRDTARKCLEIESRLATYVKGDSCFSADLLMSLAGAYGELNDYPQAISCVERLIAAESPILGKDHPVIASFWGILGAFNRNVDLDAAIAAYEKALAINVKVFGPESAEAAKDYHELAASLEEKGDDQAAIQNYAKEMNAMAKLHGKDSSRVTDCLLSIIGAESRAGSLNAALTHIEQIIEIKTRDNPDGSPLLASLRISAGYLYQSAGMHAQAAAQYEKGLAMLEKIAAPSKSDIGRAYQGLASLYGEKGDYNQAIAHYEKALAAYAETDAARSAAYAQTRCYLGDAYRMMNRFEPARAQYQAALDLLDQAGIAHDDSYGLAVYSAYIGIALGCFSSGDKASGQAYIEKLQAIRFNAKSLEFASDMITAAMYCQNDEYPAAIAILEPLLQSPIVSNSNRAQASVLFLLGLALDQTGNAPRAQERFRKAFRVWESSSNYREIMDDVWTGLRTSFRNDPSIAREAIACGVSAAERSRSDLGSAKTGLMALSLPLYYAGIDLEIRQGGSVEKAFEYSESMRNRGFLEQMGTQAALNLDGISRDERTAIEKLIGEIASYRGKLERLNESTDAQGSPSSATISENLAKAEKELDTIDERIGARVPRYRQLRNPATVDPAAARAWCGPDRVVLEYVLWDPSLADAIDNAPRRGELGAAVSLANQGEKAQFGSYCLVISSSSLTAVPLDGEYDFTGAVNALRGLILQNADDDRLEPLRNELYAKLLEPVVGALPRETKRIVIVPDGPLSYLPIDVLRKTPQSRDFGETYAVSLSPSLSVSALSDGKGVSGSARMLAVGGAWYDARKRAAERGTETSGYTRSAAETMADERGLSVARLDSLRKDAAEEGAGAYFARIGLRWQDLPGTATEVREIRDSVFAGKNLTVLEGNEATESALKKLSAGGQLRDYSLIHLACHGYFDGLMPEFSSVVLSEVSTLIPNAGEDGYLTVPEIASLNVDASLVNLSACQTGLTKVRRGDGMIGLSRAFLVAGARNVGVSLWSVADDATSEFMIRLYERVRSGMDYAEAYRATKDSFRKDPKWSRPYYWAGFALYE